MKSKLIILIALALSSCTKKYECTLRTNYVMVYMTGEQYRGTNTYHMTFSGTRKEMKAFEDERTKVINVPAGDGIKWVNTYVMTCK